MSSISDEPRDVNRAPRSLRCEGVPEPIGLDVSKPRFSWLTDWPERGQMQTLYRVQVASSPEKLESDVPDCWDSGDVPSDEPAHVVYLGAALEGESDYYWRCSAADKDRMYSPWSEIASFSTGVLDGDGWQASWIEGGGVARKEFDVVAAVDYAIVSVSGLGYYELRLNGSKVGDRVLDPGWTDYDQRVLYSSYNVTDQLVVGANAFGLMLGNGRYNPPQTMVDRSPIPLRKYASAPLGIVQLLIRYTDGTESRVVSDDSWSVAEGPILFNDIWDGERYDARRELSGWDQSGFNDSDWANAKVVSGPTGRLVSQAAFPPIKVNRSVQPRQVTNPRPGVFVFDFAQNFSGWVRLPSVTGPAGSEISMRFAELVDDEGMLNTVPNRAADATDVFVLAGRGGESYEPRFTYHGFRYCEVTGFPGTPGIADIEGRVVHSAVEPTGSFACSNTMINDLHRNIYWGQLSNLMSVPTDCPQRDERMGWMGDAQLTVEEAICNFDMSGFYAKYVADITDSQLEDGSVSDVVPAYWRLYPSDPAWGTATVVIPWSLYQFYGDSRILEEHYSTIKNWVEFLRSQSRGNLLEYGKFGDWCPPQQVVSSLTSIRFTSSWHYYSDVSTLAKIAAVLGKTEDEKYYKYLADNIMTAFNEEFLQEDRYSNEKMYDLLERLRPMMPPGSEDLSEEERRKRLRGMMRLFAPVSQTANALPLFLDMVPEGRVEGVIDNLVDDITDNRSFHLSTGIVGTRYILDVLTEYGYPDVAYQLVTQDSYPSWGYMLKEGATTLWERWEKLVEGGMNSHNHIMYGTVDSWFFKVLAGINRVPDIPAYKQVRIQPYPAFGLKHAEASIRTVRGTIRSAWHRNEGKLVLSVSLPVGSSGKIMLPATIDGQSVTNIYESSVQIWKNASYQGGVDAIGNYEADNKWISFYVGSGEYVFEVS